MTTYGGVYENTGRLRDRCVTHVPRKRRNTERRRSAIFIRQETDPA